MLPPDVEARFRKIEDDLAVTAELQRRAELRARDDSEHLRAVQAAMARWQEQMAAQQWEFAERQGDFDVKLNALIDAQMRGEAATQEMKQAVAELSRTVERFLESRSNGGAA